MSVAHLDEILKARLSPALIQRTMATHILLLSAELDVFVDNNAIEEYFAALPENISARHVHIRGAKHELLHEREEIRGRVLTEIDAFLARTKQTSSKIS
jgi:alpha-beta hydrolase superfamily lysophospholipase